MSGLYKTFQTDRKAEREGRWFDLVGVINEDGTLPGFRMARMSKSNPEYQAAVEHAAKDLKQAFDLDTLTENIAGPVMRKVFVETVLLDWRNVRDNDNNPITFSKENALKLFEDLPDLYLTLVEQAQKLSNFRNKEVEAVAKKSLPQSNTPLAKDDT